MESHQFHSTSLLHHEPLVIVLYVLVISHVSTPLIPRILLQDTYITCHPLYYIYMYWFFLNIVTDKPEYAFANIL
jgi:hypothetical protein